MTDKEEEAPAPETHSLEGLGESLVEISEATAPEPPKYASDDEALEALDPGGEDDDELSMSGTDYRPKKEEDEESEAEETVPRGTSDKNTAEKDPEADKAREQLRLYGIDASAVEEMSDASALSTWTRLAKRNADAERGYRERAELSQRLKELEAQATAKKEEPAEPTSEQADWEALVKRAKEELGDDGAEPFLGEFKSLREQNAQLASELKALSEREQQRSRERIVEELDYARVEFGEREKLVMLQQDGAWDAVVQHAAHLEKDPDNAALSLDELVGKAIGDIYGEEALKAEPEPKPDPKPKKSASDKRQPTSRTTKVAPKGLTREEKEERFLNAREAGHSKEDARRISGLA